MRLTVLRLGHRKKRDKRTTTHCALVARAFGANKIILSGEKDQSVIDSVRDIVDRWGGNFKISYKKDWKSVLKNKEVIHLTMYGMPIQNNLPEIRESKKDKIIVIGSEKVPPEVYELADFNISVSNQPHSEVSSLAIFLDRYFKGKELTKKFSKAKLKIVPQKKGKKVIKKR